LPNHLRKAQRSCSPIDCVPSKRGRIRRSLAAAEAGAVADCENGRRLEDGRCDRAFLEVYVRSIQNRGRRVARVLSAQEGREGEKQACELDSPPNAGDGLFTDPITRAKYEGQWQRFDGATKRRGAGVYTDGGATSDGHFPEDLSHAQGNYTAIDRSAYRGEWRAGLMHRPWVHARPDSAVLAGNWEIRRSRPGRGMARGERGVSKPASAVNGLRHFVPEFGFRMENEKGSESPTSDPMTDTDARVRVAAGR
jgi:hypothetical protein